MGTTEGIYTGSLRGEGVFQLCHGILQSNITAVCIFTSFCGKGSRDQMSPTRGLRVRLLPLFGLVPVLFWNRESLKRAQESLQGRQM